MYDFPPIYPIGLLAVAILALLLPTQDWRLFNLDVLRLKAVPFKLPIFKRDFTNDYQQFNYG